MRTVGLWCRFQFREDHLCRLGTLALSSLLVQFYFVEGPLCQQPAMVCEITLAQ